MSRSIPDTLPISSPPIQYRPILPQLPPSSQPLHRHLLDRPIDSRQGNDVSHGIRNIDEGPRLNRGVFDREGPSTGSKVGVDRVEVEMRTKPRPHICCVCSKSFPRPSALHAHMSVHTRIQPFSCPVLTCERRFSIQSNLKRHIRSHEKNQRKSSGSSGASEETSISTSSSADTTTVGSSSNDFHPPLTFPNDAVSTCLPPSFDNSGYPNLRRKVVSRLDQYGDQGSNWDEDGGRMEDGFERGILPSPYLSHFHPILHPAIRIKDKNERETRPPWRTSTTPSSSGPGPHRHPAHSSISSRSVTTYYSPRSVYPHPPTVLNPPHSPHSPRLDPLSPLHPLTPSPLLNPQPDEPISPLLTHKPLVLPMDDRGGGRRRKREEG